MRIYIILIYSFANNKNEIKNIEELNKVLFNFKIKFLMLL